MPFEQLHEVASDASWGKTVAGGSARSEAGSGNEFWVVHRSDYFPIKVFGPHKAIIKTIFVRDCVGIQLHNRVISRRIPRIETVPLSKRQENSWSAWHRIILRSVIMARHPFHLQEFVPTPTPTPPRRLSASFFPLSIGFIWKLWCWDSENLQEFNFLPFLLLWLPCGVVKDGRNNNHHKSIRRRCTGKINVLSTWGWACESVLVSVHFCFQHFSREICLRFEEPFNLTAFATLFY